MLVAGDLFHAVRPTNAAIIFAFRQFQRLRDALPAVPIVLIAGNHDTPRSAETGSILRLFDDLNIDVATDEPRRLSFPALGLSVLAVPHAALIGERPELRPEGDEPYQVLMLHGEVEGVFPGDRTSVEYGGAVVAPGELTRGGWSYVALGHYHVQHQVAPRIWYAGALDYVSPNIWGELLDEAAHGLHGKAWLLADLDAGTVERHAVQATRRVLDLEPIPGEGRSTAELDALIAERLREVPGGIADQIVRLRVLDVPRHVARELDHTALRAYRAEALHLNVDIRRPVVNRLVGVGGPGRRQTLPEMVREFLERRPLPAQIDRATFVRAGVELIDTVERDLAG